MIYAQAVGWWDPVEYTRYTWYTRYTLSVYQRFPELDLYCTDPDKQLTARQIRTYSSKISRP